MKHDFDEIIERRGFDGKKWNTYPADVIPMWVADSDFKSPQPIIDALAERVKHGIFGYTGNDPMFEKAAVRWVKTRFGWDADPSRVEFTPCVGAALALAVKAFSRPGDNVLVQTPIYPPFRSVTKTNGRNVLENRLVFRDGNFHIDFDDLEKKLADPKTTLFLLCNPHNPSGRAFTKEELLAMGELCRKHNVVVFSDEIHCDYVFSGHTHHCFPALSPELAAISLVSINPSKTFNIADFRTAAVMSDNKYLLDRYRAQLASQKLGRCSTGIIAFIKAYTECDYYADGVREYTEKNMRYAVGYINDRIPRLSAHMPDATYLLWMNCTELKLSQPDLVKFFVEKAKVGMNSGADFGVEGTGFMRMNLACPLSTVERAMERIEKAVKAL